MEMIDDYYRICPDVLISKFTSMSCFLIFSWRPLDLESATRGMGKGTGGRWAPSNSKTEPWAMMGKIPSLLPDLLVRPMWADMRACRYNGARSLDFGISVGGREGEGYVWILGKSVVCCFYGYVMCSVGMEGVRWDELCEVRKNISKGLWCLLSFDLLRTSFLAW